MPKQKLSVLMQRINTLKLFIDSNDYDGEAIDEFKSILPLVTTITPNEIDPFIETLDQIVLFCATHQRAHVINELYHLVEKKMKKVFIPAASRMRYYLYAGRRYQQLQQYDQAIDYFSQGLWFAQHKVLLGYAPDALDKEKMGNKKGSILQREKKEKGKEKVRVVLSKNHKNTNTFTLFAALKQEVNRLDAILCFQGVKPLLEKRLPPQKHGYLPIETLHKTVMSIEQFADMLLSQGAMSELDKLYHLIKPYVERYTQRVSDNLSICRQRKDGKDDFQSQLDTAKNIAEQFFRHKQYKAAKDLYNAFITNSETAFNFNFEQIHQAIQTVNQYRMGKIQHIPLTGEVFWQSCRKELHALRAPLSALIKQHGIAKAQRQYTKRIKELFRKIINDCIKVLNVEAELPGIHIMIIGSGARNRLHAFSDIDLAVLVDTALARHNQSLKILLQLIAYRVRLIGESEPAGFSVDVGDLAHLAKDKDLLNTPEGFLKHREFNPQYLNAETALEAYSIHRPASLYYNSKGKELLSEYMEGLKRAWQIPTGTSSLAQRLTLFSEQGKAYQKMHYQQLKSSMLVWDREDEVYFHLKERIFAPLLFWILDMGLRFGFLGETFLEPLQVLNKFYSINFTGELSFVNHIFLKEIEEAFDLIHGLRSKSQCVTQQRKDIVLKPTGKEINDRLGLNCEKRYQLTEEEWCKIKEIDQNIIQRIYKGFNKIEFRHPAYAALSNLSHEERFMQATDRGVIDIVKECVEQGVNINLVNKKGACALHLATLHKHQRVVKYLLGLDIKINQRTYDKHYTPLHVAAIRGAERIVNMLVKNHALVNARDKEGKTALHLAAEYGHKDVVSALVNQCKEDLVHMPDFQGMVPLHLAAGFGHSDVIKTLIMMGTKVDVQTREGYTPLHVAIRYQQFDAMNALLAYGANPAVQTAVRRNALHIAALHNAKKALARLLNMTQQVIHLDPPDKKGLTPLHLASWHGNIDIVTLLLEYDANAQIDDADDWSALHWVGNADVFDERHARIAALLIEKAPILVHKPNKIGWTPLHIAAWKGHIKFAQQLIKESAIINVESNIGQTPLAIAKETKQKDFVQWFEAKLSVEKEEKGFSIRSINKARPNSFWPSRIFSFFTSQNVRHHSDDQAGFPLLPVSSRSNMKESSLFSAKSRKSGSH